MVDTTNPEVLDDENDNRARSSDSARDDNSARHFLMMTQSESDASIAVTHTQENPITVSTAEFHSIPDAPSPMYTPSDNGFGNQWHLNNTGQFVGGVPGMDLNIIDIWDEYRGDGVLVGVVDDGFNYNHSDLSPNYRTDLDYDGRDGDNDANSSDPSDYHGTLVASMIGGEDGNGGMVGVAPDVDLVGYRIGFTSNWTMTALEEVFDRASAVDIVNNSWGFTTPFSDNFQSSYFDTAVGHMMDAVSTGRSGNGTVFVFSAGNDGDHGNRTDYHSFSNSPYAITVGAMQMDGTHSTFTTPGTSVLVTAPGTSTYLANDSGGYGYASGTSFSAPAVSGVIALMLEANDSLGYRDVQEILAYSSRQIDASDNGWQYNGAGNSNGGGLHHHDHYGYGLVDAHAAVRLAETWQDSQTLANLNEVTVNGAGGSSVNFSNTINVAQNFDIEWVQLNLNLNHTRVGDLDITLTGPDGTVSVLADNPSYSPDNVSTTTYTGSSLNFTFGSVKHWGENANGNWTLNVQDNTTGNTITVNSWSLKFLGDTNQNHDTYVFTNEYGGFTGAELAARSTLTDTDGGTDNLNAAAVTTASTLDLRAGNASTIVGKALTIAVGTTIENAFGGDGNDTLYGNDVANILSGGHGDDTFHASNGNDTINGGGDTDRIIYLQDITEFFFEIFGNMNLTIDHVGGGQGTDTVLNVENYTFGAIDYTFQEISDIVAAGGPNLPSASVDMRWDNGGRHVHYLNENGAGTLTDNDLGQGATGTNIVTTNRTANTIDVEQVNPSGQAVNHLKFGMANWGDITATGFRHTQVYLGDGNDSTVRVEQAQYGLVNTGDGNDDIVFSTVSYDAGSAAENRVDIDSGAGNDSVSFNGTNTNLNTVVYLRAGDDSFNSSATSDDIVYGGDGVDNVVAGAGSDRIYGDGGNDILNGGFGADFVYGGLGDDQVEGADGDDRLYGNDGADSLTGGSGNDELFGGAGNDTLLGNSGIDFLFGEDGQDIIRGGANNDVAYGGADNDTILGEHGDDRMYGGLGDDDIQGGDGTDKLFGDEGNDTIRGQADNDRLYGNDGDDTIYGGFGDDFVYGHNDDDTLYGDDGNDRIWGHSGNDIISGGDGTDRVYAGNGNDQVNGDGGTDFLYGEGGNDVMSGGADNDTLYGHAGADTLNGDGGRDTLAGGTGDDILSGGADDDWLYGQDDNDTLYGDDGDDKLYGENGIDRILGGLGNDSLYGGAGNDVLIGDQGRDFMYGGSGADQFGYLNFDGVDDRIYDFTVNGAEKDAINVTDILVGYDPINDAIADFIIATHGASYTDILIDTNGSAGGASFTRLVKIYTTDLAGMSANDMLLNGNLVDNSSLA